MLDAPCRERCLSARRVLRREPVQRAEAALQQLLPHHAQIEARAWPQMELYEERRAMRAVSSGATDAHSHSCCVPWSVEGYASAAR